MTKKQDLNGYRKPEDVVSRFKLNDIELNTEQIEEIKKSIVVDDQFSTTSENALQNKVITNGLNNVANSKVDKVTGKSLSTNDYDDTEKNKVSDAYADRHWHDNKTALDTITADKITAWDSNSSIWYVLTQTGSSNYIELPSSSKEFMIVVKGSLNIFHLGHFPKGIITSFGTGVKELGTSYSDQYDSWSCKVSVACSQNSDVRITLDRAEEGGSDITSSAVLYVLYK